MQPKEQDLAMEELEKEDALTPTATVGPTASSNEQTEAFRDGFVALCAVLRTCILWAIALKGLLTAGSVLVFLPMLFM